MLFEIGDQGIRSEEYRLIQDGEAPTSPDCKLHIVQIGGKVCLVYATERLILR